MGASAPSLYNGDNMSHCIDSEKLHARLNRIIGQIEAVKRMIDEDAPCEDVLTQISAAKSALNKAGQVILEGHISHCLRDAIENDDEKALESFAKALERFSNMQ